MNGFDALMFKLNLVADVPIPDVAMSPAILIGALFFIGILPPIVEEIYYRGIIMSALKERGMTYAIVVSSLVFSLSHQNAAQLVHQFIGGLVVAYIVAKTDNLWYGIIIHMTNNIIAVFLLLSDWWASLADMSTTSTLTMAGMFVAGIGILVGCFFAFKKLREKEAQKKAEIKIQDELQPEISDEIETSSINTDTDVQQEVMETQTAVSEAQTIKKPPSKFRKLLGKIDIYVLIMCVFFVFSIIMNIVMAAAFKDIPMDFLDEPIDV